MFVVFSLVATESMHGHRIACEATAPASNFVPRNVLDIRAVNKPDYMLRYNLAPLFVLCKSFTCSCFPFIKVIALAGYSQNLFNFCNHWNRAGALWGFSGGVILQIIK